MESADNNSFNEPQRSLSRRPVPWLHVGLSEILLCVLHICIFPLSAFKMCLPAAAAYVRFACLFLPRSHVKLGETESFRN